MVVAASNLREASKLVIAVAAALAGVAVMTRTARNAAARIHLTVQLHEPAAAVPASGHQQAPTLSV